MNPKTDTIAPKHTGIFSVNGVGRVGDYGTARRAGRCRARRYWLIREELGQVVVEHPTPTTEVRRITEDREDFGHFKTKTAAIQFMIDYAAAHPGVVLEGDLTGYPRMIIPKQIWIGNEAYKTTEVPGLLEPDRAADCEHGDCAI